MNPYHMDISAAKRAVIDAGHELVARGLIARTWGKISCRIDEDRFAVTPSGMGYDRLTENEIVVVDCHTLLHEGDIKPSGETGIHAAVYRLRPEANFAIHTHQNAASAISLAGFDALHPTAEERAVLGGDGAVPRAAYGLPCTKPLCKAVTRVLESSPANVLFMVRHGILAIGGSREEAFARAAAVEHMCERIVQTEAPTAKRAFDPAAMTAAILAADPSLKSVRFLDCDPVVRVSEYKRVLVPMLDDFAQLIGTDIRCVSPDAAPAAAVSALKGRNAVLIRGCGALCTGVNEEDATAVEYLLEKECRTELNARAYGGAKPLPFFDRAVMRRIYVQKYSKLK